MTGWLPDLTEEQAKDVCRLLDADGDGMIDFDEFSTVMAAEGDDVRKGPSGVLREREQHRVASQPNAKGRFGATPSFSFGIQARELLHSFPGAAGYASDAERLAAPSVGHQLVPDWQVADAARKAQKAAVRRDQVRYHTQRIEAAAAARQAKAEATHDARMESLIQQNQRYLSSVANENRASLKVQATFRHMDGKEAPTALSVLTSPRGGR